MDTLFFILVILTCIQIFLTMRKYKKFSHIEALLQVDELMDYIDKGDLSLTDETGKNAFLIACSRHYYSKKGELGFDDVVRHAIESGVDVNTQNIANGKTAIMYALHNKEDYNIAKLLIDANADMDVADASGRLPIFDSIKTGKHYDDIVTRTFDLNHQDQYGVSALMIAAYEMDFKIIDDLIERHVDPRLRNVDGETAYTIAQKYIDRHIHIAIETSQDDEFGKSNTITTSKDVLNAQKHNHKVRETVRKLKCYENGEPYTEKKFKRPFFKTGKAN